MDLSRIKIGDQVKSYTKGWLEVSALYENYFHAECNGHGPTHRFYYNGEKKGRFFLNDEKSEIIDWRPAETDLETEKPWESKKPYCTAGTSDFFIPNINKEEKKALCDYWTIYQFVKEHDQGQEIDWNNEKQRKFFVYYHQLKDEYDESEEMNTTRDLGQIYMTKKTAEKLCEMLNKNLIEGFGKRDLESKLPKPKELGLVKAPCLPA